jgi:colanic acid/amylovoran biosynthesis glycosyltransferase
MPSLQVAYVVEPPYSTFALNEILALRGIGVGVTVLNSYRPFAQPQPVGEKMRAEAHYFSAHYAGLPAALLRAMGHPRRLMRVVAAVLRHKLSPRLLLLAAEYAEVVRRGGVTHVHAMYGTTPATIAVLTAWLAGVPYSFTCHAYEIYLSNPLLGWKAAGAAFVTTISRFNERYMLERWPIDPRRLHVVHLGVDADHWNRPTSRSPRSERVAEVVCVAALIPCKGHAWLLRAAALLRERHAMRVTLVGDGECRKDLEREAEQLQLTDVVVFAGAQPHEVVRRLVQDADLFVLPCIVDDTGYHDGLPVALMEAMAAGVPVISTTVSGIPELVEDERSGLLVAPRDAGALARAIGRVLDNPALSRALAEAGRDRVRSEFSLERNATAMRRLFDGAR